LTKEVIFKEDLEEIFGKRTFAKDLVENTIEENKTLEKSEEEALKVEDSENKVS